MEVLWIFGSWDQESNSWFINYEPLIPTLAFINIHRFLVRLGIHYGDIIYDQAYNNSSHQKRKSLVQCLPCSYQSYKSCFDRHLTKNLIWKPCNIANGILHFVILQNV